MLNVLHGNKSAPQPDGEDDAATVELSCQMDVMRVVAHVLAVKRQQGEVPHRALVEVAGLANCERLCEAVREARLMIGEQVGGGAQGLAMPSVSARLQCAP
jgi:hypothetical protein